VVLLAVWCHENIEAHEVAPSEVKCLATGRGNADKAAVTAAAVSRWGPTVDDSDIADACWVAEHCRLAMHRLYGGAE
jgi:Holliday junction resolvasome RuvABC endonuclease subunit